MSKKIRYAETRRAPATVCPACLYVIDAATSFNKKADVIPKPGAITVCTNCYLIGEYDDALQIRKLTPEAYAALQLSPVWPDIQMVIKSLRAVKKR